MIVKKSIQYAKVIDRQGDCGVFDTMNDAIKSAYIASEDYSKYSLSRKNEIIEAVTEELKTHLEELTSMTCKELNTNSYDDNLNKNRATLNNSKNDKYLESRLAAKGKVNNCSDIHIVNGILVSCSNPIETIINYSLSVLKAGNAIVFSSNKNSKDVIAYAIKLINNSISAVDGPKNLVVTVKEPSEKNTSIMIEDERITMLSAGNNAAEKIAL